MKLNGRGEEGARRARLASARRTLDQCETASECRTDDLRLRRVEPCEQSRHLRLSERHLGRGASGRRPAGLRTEPDETRRRSRDGGEIIAAHEL